MIKKVVLAFVLALGSAASVAEAVPLDRLEQALDRYKEDKGVQECLKLAAHGDKYAYYAILYIAESELLIQERLRLHEESSAGIKSGDSKSVYQKIKKFSLGQNLQRVREVSEMLPRAIDYCSRKAEKNDNH